MTITTTKTWQFDLNNYAPSDSTLGGTNAFFDRRNMLLGIKDALTGFASSPWTVVSSSDSSTASASDLWLDEGDLVWRDDDTAGAFSWIVLRQAAISTTFELLITCEEDSTANDGSQIGAWVAQAGFTGGTTTARPTATDERQLRDSTANHWGSGANGLSYDFRYHVMMSADGECTRVLIFIAGVNTGFWLFDKPKNPVAAWTTPYFAFIRGNNDSTTNQANYAILYDSAQGNTKISGQNVSLYLSGEGFGSAAVGEQITVQNQLDGSFSANGVGLCSTDSIAAGRIGEVFDLWWGLTVVPTGRYYPADGSMNYVQVHHLIFPWDGSTFIGTE